MYIYTYLYDAMRKDITKFSNLFAIFRKKLNKYLKNIEKQIPIYNLSYEEKFQFLMKMFNYRIASDENVQLSHRF